MTSYDFTLRLDRTGYLNDAEIDAAYEATGGDADVTDGPNGVSVSFNREAASLAAALSSAVGDLARIGLRAVGVVQDDEVTLRDIAARTGRSYEAVRMWAAGKRAGEFPAPHFTTSGGERLWSWTRVAAWLRDRLSIEVSATPHELVAADRILAAADALRTEPADTRSELEKLFTAA